MRATIQGADAKKAKKSAAVEPEPSDPTTIKADLFIAMDFPKWQEEAIEILRSNFDPQTKALLIADDKLVALLKPIMATVKDKSVLKKFIPFVMELKDKLLAEGERVLNRALPFNEVAVLEENMDYITKSLGILTIQVHADPSVEDADAAKRFESALPGCPSVRITKS